MESWKAIKTAPKDGTPIQVEGADGSQERATSPVGLFDSAN